MHIYLRYAIFFGVVSGLLFGVNYFVYRRLCVVFSLEGRSQRRLKALLLGSVVLMIGGRILERSGPSRFAHSVGVLGAVVVLGVAVTFAILLVDTLVRAGVRTARAVAEYLRSVQSTATVNVAPEADSESIDETRREVLSKVVASTAVVLGGGSSVYAVAFGRRDYVIEEVPIRLARLPRELDGFTLVQLSDLHVGLDVGDEELAAALELVIEARPDHIVLTGDLIDHDIRFASSLGRFVRRLVEQAPVSAVVGNHDYYTGVSQTIDVVRRAGGDVLVNTSKVIAGKLVLGGVDDVWARRQLRRGSKRPSSGRGLGHGPDVARAFENADPDLARVLLCHNPSYFPEAADLADLQLSGHTHGGQFSPLVNPARLVLRHGYIRGRYQRGRAAGDRTGSASQLYVNRGFGTAGPPARIGSPPEVSKIILVS